ncbi:hypothetical protein A2926_01015 [Candidatus Giovannonibacteria bacterium RIFCSPLOWO2_01_FULL_44_40]|uniref:Uncharacterized protein n=1 Tax=Candidatus Giovannonibacteria bacterium RIFCSPHIGHO2_01_FULL_45_23 TaxID=1798325 RepID=A0A1F5VGS2_9BACT|nr:MAG: hypothetical protein A2834_02675 [Candidatus Giovannonibacteria bacterium RIFCSPHIGHO2_01_FULL_45_23]OGF75164.1 MAG: hypothetical protein A3C77_03720 [Candidatus Giovannonibacteria bacterium RIFCSPHIGHO2_02_FULL_45_13]OGF80017.1 MAG: hypothetical protein A2926_01015 [Candidatus Giovannonibacteria bacterium RIFCSPLOWO2_01_FULL_44_40]
MEREPTEQEEKEALEWLLKEKEGKGIKILDPKTERKGREKAKKEFKKRLGEFGQKELFKKDA